MTPATQANADDTPLLVKVCKNETDPSQEVVNQFFQLDSR